jgi:dTDP-4-dehydrorhamnose reductase
MVRWLVAGANGMLGQDVVAVLRGAGHEVTAVDRDELDITSAQDAFDGVAGHDVVMNCAAWTAVDAAEEREADAFAVNAVGPQMLARAAAAHGAKLVQISTDYVFDGVAQEPYAENGAMAPRSAYGRTKAAGEWAVQAFAPDHLIVRTAWLYGERGACFPRTIARAVAQRGSLDVVADQVGQPTWTADLADLVLRLVDAQAPSGIYHGTSEGTASWHTFAQAVVAAAGMDPEIVRPTTSGAYAAAAARPAFSVLGHDALRAAGVEPIGEWTARWKLAAPRVLGA